MVRFALGAACFLCPMVVRAAATPNVVVFFVDDMGYGDLGVYGAPTTQTPHVDRMASEGATFTQWYSAHAICTPSRAAILTGRLPIRFGLASRDDGSQAVFGPRALKGIPDSEVTLAQLMKKAGYATQMVGKWHLGHQPEFLPTSKGFDHFFGLPLSVDGGFIYGNATWQNDNVKVGQVPLALLENEAIVEQPADISNLTARYTEKVVEFVEKQHAAEKPFFIYYAFSHVHHPQFASPAFCGTSQRGVFGDSVEEVDGAVGDVMHLLHRLNIVKNTLMIFTSDNGAPDSKQHLPTGVAPSPMIGSNGPFLGAKTQTWEGGLRVPGIIWWPGHVHPRRVSHQASTLDVLATVADAVGIEKPGSTDSVSLLPVLRGESARAPRETQFFYRGATLGAVRHKQWKLHLDTTEPTVLGEDVKFYAPFGPLEKPLLFQIEHDPSERFPVLDRPDVVTEILAVVKKHLDELGTPPTGVLNANGDADSQLCCDHKESCYCSPPPTTDAVFGLSQLI